LSIREKKALLVTTCFLPTFGDVRLHGGRGKDIRKKYVIAKLNESQKNLGIGILSGPLGRDRSGRWGERLLG